MSMFEFEVGQTISMKVDSMDNDLRAGEEVKVVDREERDEMCGACFNYYQVQSSKTGRIEWVGEHELKK